MNTEAAPAQPTKISLHAAHRIREWHEVLISLNLASVSVYCFLSYCQSFGFGELARDSDLGYCLRSSALRLDDFLHVSSTNMQLARYAPRFMASRSASMGAELLIVISALAIAFLLFSFFHAATAPALRQILDFVTGVTAIFALPVTYAWFLKLESPRGAAYGFWRDFRPAFLGAEILVVVLLIAVSRMRSLSLWMTVPLVLSHCIFWLYFSWPHFYAFPQQELFSPLVLIVAFPFSAIMWLIYWKTARIAQPQQVLGSRPGLRAVGTVATIVVLFLAWRPAHAQPIGRYGRVDSLVIELQRSSCFGPCRPYDMTIRGDGEVAFTGHGYQHPEYTNHATLTREQVSKIVQVLDRSQLFALEDRAFVWCFDTPTVSVSVSTNGKSKEVGSDSGCTGARAGRQARFVQAAAEIDAIVGTKQWIQR